MESNKEKKLNKAFVLVFLTWLVYTVSYLGKVNYSANITQIIDFYKINKAQAGIVPTFFFFAYGAGQFVNGLLCKKYNIKWIIFLSLCVSGIVNLIIAVSTRFSIIKWLWLINGLSLSVLWPTIIRQLSEALPQKLLGISGVIMGTTVAMGTIIIYGLSSVFAAFHKFKLSFYTAAIAVFAVAVIWIVFYNRALSSAKSAREQEKNAEINKSNEPAKKVHKKNEIKLLFATIYVLCFFAIGINLIKDGLTTWVPAILKEEFLIGDSLSILLTLLLPVLAVFGNVCALKMHKIIPDYINQCAVTFGIIGIFIGIIISSLTSKVFSFMIIGVVVVNFFASTLNSLITSIFPMFMRDKVNSGLFAGVLNGFCYFGSTISSYGLGAIADKWGWAAVFKTLIGFVIISLIVWCAHISFKRFFNKKHIYD